MGHIPHLLIPGPWTGDHLELSSEQRHHLEKVLRVRDGELATYTDGTGTLGHGRYETGRLSRNDEGPVPAPSDLIVVVAPPDHRERARFMVEKLSEMGVAELRFLDTRHSQGRPPKRGKLLSWAASGLEQSRGAWLMKTSDRLATFADLSPPFAVCDLGGRPETPLARTVVIGPEGGWASEEVPQDALSWGLGDTVLRVETAALVAAARLL